MLARLFQVLTLLLSTCATTAFAAAGDDFTLLEHGWFEARTIYFHTYSCGPTQEVAKLAGRLEQFRETYATLAGTQAVASPPIIVLAFPDHASLKPFLQLYHGQPANLAGFFSRGSDENLIVLSLADTAEGSLQTIFHEFAHLLFRRNEQVWPLWLKEGMADIYSTFEVAGPHRARIGKPPELYLRLLERQPLMSLEKLFAVNHDSPEYNEREKQGMFYAESWLLTHYLMIGDKGAHRTRFGALTRLLAAGEAPKAAFVNALGSPLPVMEKALRDYLDRASFEPLTLAVHADLLAPQPLAMRRLSPVETCFRLGDELLRVGRFEEAEAYFQHAERLAPAGPLGVEGLGLLAAERGQHAEAMRYLEQAIRLGSQSYLAHFAYAREKFRLTAKAPDTYGRLEKERASEIEAELEKSLALMPNFGPAHHLLGFVQMLQGEDLGAAEKHLERAIQLEPENPAYLLALAQAELFQRQPAAARQTLELLCRPYVDEQLQAQARRLIESVKGEE
ncbi:MAG TPA: tetratricopeptide repeat protein [Verrucomicrobiae bacterium]|nr:tetratricopeptide repeat protein [Verrucomicrobiae bacterium]